MPGWMNLRQFQSPYPAVDRTSGKSQAGWLVGIGRYGVAFLAVVLALLLMLVVDRWVPMAGSPFLIFFASVMISAWYGGLGPGVFAIAIALLAADYFFELPFYSFGTNSLAEGLRLSLFALVSLLIVSLSATRRRLVKELWQERDLISAVVTTAGSLIMVLDRDGRVVQFNRTCERITGYTLSEVSGKRVWDLFIPLEEVEAVKAVFDQLQTGRLPSEYEGDWLIRDGKRRRIAWSNTVLFNEQGLVRYVIATGIDVTDRYRAKQQLQETNLQLQALVQAAPVAITVLDRQGIVKLWNPTAERIFGWRAEEVLGQFLPSVPAEKRSEFQQHIALTLDGNLLNGLETCRQRKDGSSIYVSLWTAVFHNGNDENDRILSIVADLSERKRAEAERQQAEAALKSTQEKLTHFFESNIIGILFGDVAGDIEQANDEFLRMVGYSQSDLHAGKLRWIALTPSEYFPLDQAAIAEVKERGACTPYEKEFICKDGSRIPVLVGFTLTGESRQQAVAFILDLTERKQLEQALHQQAEALAQANRLKDEFLAVLSHELRTPLNSILGWSKLLRIRQFDTETATRALETIERNARLQSQLIEDILDVSKIVQGKLCLQPQAIKLMPVIQAALETMRPAAAAKRIQLQFQPDADPCVLGDAERLQQVVWNLLSNAIKFTPEGGQVTVVLASSLPTTPNRGQPASNHDVEIRITDTGSGISPAFLPFVFDRFRQEDSSTTRLKGGLGLGLSIVRYLVELHGGTVRADSLGQGQGATFTVRLPRFDEGLAISRLNDSVQEPDLNDRSWISPSDTRMKSLYASPGADA